MKEIFVPVDNFEGYLISNYGRVYSLKLNKFLKPYLTAPGRSKRLSVGLHKNGVRYTKAQGKLVLEHFDSYSQYNETTGYLNLNEQDNNIDNLEWFTRGEWQRYKNMGKKRGAYYWNNGKYSKWRSALKLKTGQIKTLGYFKTKKEAQECFYTNFTKEWGYAPW